MELVYLIIAILLVLLGVGIGRVAEGKVVERQHEQWKKWQAQNRSTK